jgi:hypothetical protein
MREVLGRKRRVIKAEPIGGALSIGAKKCSVLLTPKNSSIASTLQITTDRLAVRTMRDACLRKIA